MGSIYICIRCFTIKNNDTGESIRYGMISDVSERVRYEQEIIKREEEIRLLFENIPLPVVVMDKFRNVSFLNKAFTAIFGYEKGDISDFDRWIKGAFPFATDNDIREYVAAIANEMSHTSIDIKMTRKNGEICYVRLFKRIIGSRIILILEDITSERISEKRMKRLNEILIAINRAHRTIHGNKDVIYIMQTVIQHLSQLSTLSAIFRSLIFADERRECLLIVERDTVMEHDGNIPQCVSDALGGEHIYRLMEDSLGCKDCNLRENEGDVRCYLFPISYKRFYGVFNITVKNNDVLSEDEINLFMDLAHNLAIRFNIVEIERENEENLERTKRIASLPAENPNPVMRVDKDGILQYANSLSLRVLKFWGTAIGSNVPQHIFDVIRSAIDSQEKRTIDCYVDDKIFEFLIVPFAESGYANLYGVDITERKRYADDLGKINKSLEVRIKERTDRLARSEMAATILKDIVVLATNFELPREIISESAYQLAERFGFKAYGYWLAGNNGFDVEFSIIGSPGEIEFCMNEIDRRVLSALVKMNLGANATVIITKDDLNSYSEFTSGAFERCGGILLVPITYTSITLGMILLFCQNDTIVDEIILNLLGQMGVHLGSIIKQRESERERERIKHLYQTVLNTAGDGIVSTDKDLNIIYVNPAFEKISGYSRSEVTGLNIHELLHKGYGDELHSVEQCPFYVTMKTRVGVEVEDAVFINKKGENVYVNKRVRPIIEDGDSNGIVVIFRDVTEDKRKADEINRLASAIEQYPVAIGFLDIDGKIIHINGAFEEIQGLKREEIINRNIEEFNPGLMRYVDSCTEGKCKYLQGRISRPDGSVVCENVTLAPIRSAGGVVSNYVVIKENITQHVEAEEMANKAKVAAEESNRAKSSFLAAMSHELRTPLTGIKGYVDNLLGMNCDEKQIEFLKKAQISVDHMITIINDILDFSKVESGKMGLEIKGFDLYKEIEKIKSVTQIKAFEKNLEYRWDLSSDIPRFLMGDSKRLSQVLINLIGNAIKFTSDGGIYVSVSREDLIDDRVVLLFSVRDTGIGIRPEDKIRIFNPFEQADQSSYSRKYEGTGLGLSISKWIVESMNGEIWVESQIQKGSTFYFTAEFEITTEDKIEVDEIFVPPPAMLSGARILIVEDNEINRELALAMLHKYGAETECALDGQEAVGMIRSHPTDYYTVVLMDIQMPIMDGITATKVIRAEEKYRDLPIIALTAHAFRDEIENMLSSGMSGHISKPFVEHLVLKEISKFYCNRGGYPDSKKESARTIVVPDYLKSISVLDLEGALLRVGGDVEKYVEMLGGFAVKYGEIDRKIGELISDKKIKEAKAIVHMIKGVSGNLGIKNLYNKSVYLDNILKNEDSSLIDIQSAFDSFSSELKIVRDELRGLPPISDREITPIDDSAYRERLGELMRHLEEDDFISSEIFRRIKGRLISELGKDIVDRIGYQIENMNYQEAFQMLNAALQSKSTD